jgi:hypothetical protein
VYRVWRQQNTYHARANINSCATEDHRQGPFHEESEPTSEGIIDTSISSDTAGAQASRLIGTSYLITSARIEYHSSGFTLLSKTMSPMWKSAIAVVLTSQEVTLTGQIVVLCFPSPVTMFIRESSSMSVRLHEATWAEYATDHAQPAGVTLAPSAATALFLTTTMLFSIDGKIFTATLPVEATSNLMITSTLFAANALPTSTLLQGNVPSQFPETAKNTSPSSTPFSRPSNLGGNSTIASKKMSECSPLPLHTGIVGSMICLSIGIGIVAFL